MNSINMNGYQRHHDIEEAGPFQQNKPTNSDLSKKKMIFGGLLALVLVACIIVAVSTAATHTFSSSESASIGNVTAALVPLTKYDLTVMMDDTSLVCNDGTPAVYYVRKSTDPNERRWVVRFAGGGSCGSEDLCAGRWVDRPWDMSSTDTVQELLIDESGGILNADPAINENFYNWNHVYAFYCSSDSWLGSRPADEESSWHFMGFNIFWGIINSVMLHHGMDSASQIVTAGMSVGSVSLLNNVDRLTEFYTENVPEAEIYFLADSSWMVVGWMWGLSKEDESYHGAAQYNYQHSVMADECLVKGYTWECFYTGDYQYETIVNKDKLVIAEQMFDRQKLGFEFGSTDTWTPDMWDFALARAEYVVDSITTKALNLFMSNCRTHDTLNHLDFQEVQINDKNWTDIFYAYTSSQGTSDMFYIDGVIWPESNPTCVLSQEEWNYEHCGDFRVSDC